MTSLLSSIFGSGRRASMDSHTSEPPSDFAAKGQGQDSTAYTPRTSIGSQGRNSMSHVPSFNDFSLGTSDDVESELAVLADYHPAASKASEPLHAHPARTNVWQSTFSPGMNSNMQQPSFSRGAYDHVDAAKESTSVWAHIAKADAIKRISFNTFDQNKDGFIDAAELRSQLGGFADVENLIKKADKDGNGKIDYTEFCELLRDS